MGETNRLKQVSVNLGLTLVAILMALAICEVLVRAFVLVRNVGPDYSRYDPIYGKRLKRSFSAVRVAPEFTMTFSTNSLGFRGPEPGHFPHRSIVFLGDSFTAGYGVSDGEEYPDRVRTALQVRFGADKVHVLNAGIENTGNGHWVKFLRREGKRIQPRLVVLQLTDNDFTDNHGENQYRLGGSGNLVELPIPPPGLKWRLKQHVIERISFLQYSYLVGVLGQSWRAAANSNLAEQARKQDEHAVSDSDLLTFKLVEACLRICRENGWPALAVTVRIAGPQLTGLQEVFSRFAIDVISVPTKLERPDLYHKIDGHWNSFGHAYVAEELLRHPGLIMTTFPASAF